MLWGERDNTILRGAERDLSVVWSFVRFYVSLWALLTQLFYNYFLSLILLDSNPFSGILFCGLGFCITMYFFIFSQ